MPLAEIITATAAAISAGATLAGTTAASICQSGPNRNCVIELTNHLDTSLYGGNTHVEWGLSNIPPQTVIAAKTREAIQYRKHHNTATGTSAIFSYTINDDSDPATFVIAFSVPFNCIHGKNWFGLKFVPNETKVTKELYVKIYHDEAWHNPAKHARVGYARDGKALAIFHNSYIISASMANVGKCVLKVDVQKVEEKDAYTKYHHKFT